MRLPSLSSFLYFLILETGFPGLLRAALSPGHKRSFCLGLSGHSLRRWVTVIIFFQVKNWLAPVCTEGTHSGCPGRDGTRITLAPKRTKRSFSCSCWKCTRGQVWCQPHTCLSRAWKHIFLFGLCPFPIYKVRVICRAVKRILEKIMCNPSYLGG